MQDPHYPEEYRIGEVVFFGRKFFVTPDVLIPRLETEGLVRRARKLLENSKYHLIDIGTGSGIIAISCADIALSVTMTDVSSQALSIAKKNYTSHFPNGEAEFILMNLFESEKISLRNDASTLIVTNLPYIQAGDWENMSLDTRYEPELALFGGKETGFELYEALFEQIAGLNNSQKIILIIEFGYDQRDICENILKKYGWKYEFFADYAGIERFCEIVISKRIFPQ